MHVSTFGMFAVADLSTLVWQYAQSMTVPTTQWWRGQQSEPRELTLQTVNGQPEVFQVPLRELNTLRAAAPHRETNTAITGERALAATTCNGSGTSTGTTFP